MTEPLVHPCFFSINTLASRCKTSLSLASYQHVPGRFPAVTQTITMPISIARPMVEQNATPAATDGSSVQRKHFLRDRRIARPRVKPQLRHSYHDGPTCGSKLMVSGPTNAGLIVFGVNATLRWRSEDDDDCTAGRSRSACASSSMGIVSI